MSDVVHLDERTVDLDVGKTGNGYSKVILNVTDELFYEAGDDSGDTLEVTCPWGTQAIADSILNSVQGYRYQPYDISQAMIDPSAELGDAVSVGSHDLYGGLYEQKTEFGKMCFASASAPNTEEAESEYPYKPRQERKVERRLATVESELKVQADEISAKVSETGGSDESFSWQLNKDAFILKASNQEVMKVNYEGAHITGKITATEGDIGGFTISSSAIYSGVASTYSGTTNGVHLSSSGIRLGSNFKVNSSGSLTATSATLDSCTITGTLMVGGSSITAAKLRSGASYGSSYGTNIGTANGSGWNNAPSYFSAKQIWCSSLIVSAGGGAALPNSTSFQLEKFSWKTLTVDGSTYKFLVAK